MDGYGVPPEKGPLIATQDGRRWGAELSHRQMVADRWVLAPDLDRSFPSNNIEEQSSLYQTSSFDISYTQISSINSWAIFIQGFPNLKLMTFSLKKDILYTFPKVLSRQWFWREAPFPLMDSPNSNKNHLRKKGVANGRQPAPVGSLDS